ncbi:putative RNA methyltransferase [Aliidiomarina indica]|uniref:putative RNA methyltransferase n=1 Tax=Aliidiomarina indica TaxID=2749147 RepID=UPI00188F50A0|nr:methyltransferase domain-containing protein [Aliidiomarina indica]
MIQLCCPLDGHPLTPSSDQRSYTCSNNHRFDVAKEGYLNLLPAQHKRSKDPGDSKEMVQARQLFLNNGYYQAIAAAVADTLNQCNAMHILDAGCGEGYYLRQIAEKTAAKSLIGVDISKWAVRAAAKQHRLLQDAHPCQWLVASNAALPLPKQSIDAVLCMFGFPVYAEFSRVLKENGYVLLVEPGPDHLIELRRILYPEVRQPPPRTAVPDGWALRDEHRVRQSIHLPDASAIAQLLAMTPHIHRAGKAGREAIATHNQLDLTIDVQLQELAVIKPQT